jgi:hypothetical protein
MFYIIERSDQLQRLPKFEDCFVRFIPKSNNYHPILTELSLIYIRPLEKNKGYILCLNHSESFGLDQTEVFNYLLNNTNRLWVQDKKKALYWFYPLFDKLYDINFVGNIEEVTTICSDYFYHKHSYLPNINCLIPISKHYEESELLFEKILPLTINFTPTPQFEFNNSKTVEVFFQIEKQGIKLDKNCFIEYYKENLKNPEYNIQKGKIYTQYNLYTTTSRPSNTFNNINFAALNKDNGERRCYKPENDMFIEMDFQGYHPRLIGELVGFPFLNSRNTYETLSTILNVTQQEAKELTFKQLYGGVWSEYASKPFFKDVISYIDGMWDSYQYGKYITTENKIFIYDNNITQTKLFNYVVQSKETSTNVQLLKLVLDYLKDKKTKLVLYTYDAFLFDYSKDDENILENLSQLLHYPIHIKQGKSYHGLINL